MVRKDIKAAMIQQLQLTFSCTILRIRRELTHFHIANTYAMDSQLHLPDILLLFDTYDNLVLAGDLNAKHHHILPHTQKTKYNSIDKQLHIFLEGLNGPFSTPA